MIKRLSVLEKKINYKNIVSLDFITSLFPILRNAEAKQVLPLVWQTPQCCSAAMNCRLKVPSVAPSLEEFVGADSQVKYLWVKHKLRHGVEQQGDYFGGGRLKEVPFIRLPLARNINKCLTWICLTSELCLTKLSYIEAPKLESFDKVVTNNRLMTFYKPLWKCNFKNALEWIRIPVGKKVQWSKI